MNKLMIIGNLTADPELRTTQSGKSVCTFTVAVNRRDGETDFFRVSAWENRGEVCKKFLLKGKKVCVIGPVSVHTYLKQNGETGASLEVTASDVEFLSQRGEITQAPVETKVDKQSGFEQVDTDELPFL